MVKTLFDNIYEGYAYSYPHKHSYRKLEPLKLSTLWQHEKKDALFLYVHLPFCEMRCGFCNLFTIANPQENMVDAYLTTLSREASAIQELVAPEGFGQMAVGGGTPSFLDTKQLEKLFSIIRQSGCNPSEVPASFELSPATITKEKLSFLANQGISRVSMGIQSFSEAEVKALGRPQKNKEVYEAIHLLQQYHFNTINIDLIYGVAGQTPESWLHSVQETINLGIDEVFLYPLYVRPLTGITKINQVREDNRFQLYKAAKQLLLSEDYEQISMRLFRKVRYTKEPAISYSCQEDGMIGMGAGARSYAGNVHYSSEYAVSRQHIRSIIESYINRTDFSEVDYGIILDKVERQRRFVIKSILHGTGLDVNRYKLLFENDPLHEYDLLNDLIESDLAIEENGILKLTGEGMDYSDAIGPALYSEPSKN